MQASGGRQIHKADYSLQSDNKRSEKPSKQGEENFRMICGCYMEQQIFEHDSKSKSLQDLY